MPDHHLVFYVCLSVDVSSGSLAVWLYALHHLVMNANSELGRSEWLLAHYLCGLAADSEDFILVFYVWKVGICYVRCD